MFVPLIMGNQKGRYKHITMALLDSGNLLQQPAINAGFHRSLGIKIDKTNVVARGANQVSIDIEGNIKGNLPKVPQPEYQLPHLTLSREELGISSQLGEQVQLRVHADPSNG